MSARITVYTSPQCAQCWATERALRTAGIDFETVDLATTPEAVESVRELGHKQAPVVIDRVNGIDWSGSRPDLISQLEAVTA